VDSVSPPEAAEAKPQWRWSCFVRARRQNAWRLRLRLGLRDKSPAFTYRGGAVYNTQGGIIIIIIIVIIGNPQWKIIITLFIYY
jgi:hypothetical protein